MYDNGLLEYYRTNAFKDGFIDTEKVGILKSLNSINLKTMQCTIDGRSYYSKVHTPDGILKANADAEILLSQIYTKLGIPSSIYIPAQNQGRTFLLCDDVEKPNVVLATNYISKQFSSNKPRVMPFLSNGALQNSSRLYTKHAMAQQTKMRILDTASFNTDRHLANFFYTLQRALPEKEPIEDYSVLGRISSYFRSLNPNKAEDVVAIDFESSGRNVEAMLNEDESNLINNYMNDFQRGVMSRTEMLEEIKSNEALATLIDKPQLAEDIGSLNPASVAEDIKQTTGYEVDVKFVDTLSKAYDEMAECLMK